MNYATVAYKGYFIGTSSTPDGKGRFVGWAQICVDRPESHASAKALETLRSVGAYDDATRAMQAAEFQARQVIDGLKPNWAPFTAPGWASSR